MKISIIGCGYVGLVTGACLAHIGHDVVCVDNDAEKIKSLKKGSLPIYEPGLKDLLRAVVKKRRLTFSSSIKDATAHSTVIFLAVNTPTKPNGQLDLGFIENVTRQIAEHMDSYKLIVQKARVPADTGERIRRTVLLNLPRKYRKGTKSLLDFDVAANPEFLQEGSAIEDFLHPDRIVIGVGSKRAERILRDVYKPLKAKIMVTDICSAEMIKHASNAFLATKISFINCVSRICDQVGADVLKVAEGMGFDKRINRSFLDAGVGYGGISFPKDVDVFLNLSERSGYDFRLLKDVRRVNEEQGAGFVRLVEDKIWNLQDKVIGVWGVAFKPNTDDIRHAPALDIIRYLQEGGAAVKVYDPQAMDNARGALKDVTFAEDPYAAAKGTDALLLLTEWEEFRKVDLAKVGRSMRQKIVFDGRNFLDREKALRAGFEYYGVGRGEVSRKKEEGR